MDLPSARIAIGTILASGVMVTAVPAAPLTYTEDFTGNAFEDVANTTAFWDTSSGLLRLLPFQPSLLGSVASNSTLHATAVAGDVVYTAAQPGEIFDISDPTNPVALGTLPTIGDTRDLVVAGNYAYTADGASGFTVLNITNPASASRVVTRSTIDFAAGIEVVANHAYVAMSGAGLQVYDIVNRSNPIARGSYDTAGSAVKVAVAGDYAYVADSVGGLAIVNINNPLSLSLASTFATGGTANDVVVDGDLVYVAAGAAGLILVDVSDPMLPVLAGSAATLGDATGLDVDGNTVFVTAGAAGLQLFDVTDPTNPAAGAVYDSPGSANGVTAFGDHALLADGASGLHVWRHAIRSSVPSTIYTLSLPNSFGTKPLELDGNLLYVNTLGRAQIYDVTDPTSYVFLGEYTSPVSGAVGSVAADGDLMAVSVPTGGGSNSGVQIVDVSDPTNPTFLGLWFQTGGDSPLYFVGNTVYVLHDSTSDTIRVLDISNPASPALVSTLFLSQRPIHFKLDGEYAYVGTAQGVSGSTVFLNTSNPRTPSQLTSTTLGPGGQAFHGDRLYVVDPPRLYTLDIANLPTLVTLDNLDFGESSSSFELQATGDEVFMTSNDGMRVFDISDPSSPTLLGLGADTRGEFELAGDLAFSVDGNNARTIRIRSRDFDVDANTATSLDVHGDVRSVLAARITTTQTEAVAWELSANGGANWDTFVPGDPWQEFSNVGNDLRWRAMLSQAQSGVDPTVSSLTLEYLLEIPILDVVEDVGNDNGGQVRLRWTRSAYDRVFSSPGITRYDLYRAVDGPPGGYDFLRSIPATTDDSYAAVVPTLGDSTVAGGQFLSTFLVRARTDSPLVFFESDPLSGYSLDNLVPNAPQSLQATTTGEGNVSLSWDAPSAPDLDHYNVYRDGGEGFLLVQATVETSWLDVAAIGGARRYRVTAVDDAGNESAPSEVELTATAAGLPVASAVTLGRSYPNPFNPRVTIPYRLPTRQRVSLRVFDAAGRTVAILVDRAQEPGWHEVTWNGQDDAGRALRSGVYFYRLVAGDQRLSGRMVLVK